MLRRKVIAVILAVLMMLAAGATAPVRADPPCPPVGTPPPGGCH